ncbi:DUF2235 domain-containing protein [Mycobacterium sp. Y57]|uniref:phospholipase effector Tle1 domain-containing protein n=1 Tax=Mycolicibacterium xanthum TaxID=2796469 RepID=UPI001C84ED57|nr:DUF2235 domain-containing protein [Mycolicibacterium xanthum]MBX7432251.1 DUF2235 domain-containing protein [Mycolicibacterium xanthum]
MKNIALCFDHVCDRSGSDAMSNVSVLAQLLDSGDAQLVWFAPPPATPGRYRPGARRGPREAARASVVAAYEFLVEHWEPGDRIHLFGAGRGAFCARALARLLGTVGVLRGPGVPGWTAADFREYVLSTYAMPRTGRSAADWQRVGNIAAGLSGTDVAVDVAFLGLWDTLEVPGVPPLPDPLPTVAAVRHAVAIDGGFGPFGARPLGYCADGVQEVWFRGAHCDVAGGPNACAPLTRITLDWMLDGATTAGVALRPSARHRAPAPSPADALAGSTRPVPLRTVPADAAVHASVQIYLRSHPSYWRRLPARFVWADLDWVARAERLMPEPAAHATVLVGVS